MESFELRSMNRLENVSKDCFGCCVRYGFGLERGNRKGLVR